MKTVYRIYKKPPKNLERDDLSIREKYPLYAITDNKELFHEFESQRDMDKAFIVKKSKVDHEEYVSLYNSNAMKELKRHSFTARKTGEDTNEPFRKVTLVTNEDELNLWSANVEDGMSLLEMEIQWKEFPVFLFKNKYIKCLSSIEFYALWKFFCGDQRVFKEFVPEEVYDEMENCYAAPSVSYDEFSIFVGLFMDTMKIS